MTGKMKAKGQVSMRIAICDDCAADAEELKSRLTGHAAVVYTDAESLLTDVESRSFCYDLYLLDIYITESADGIELAKRIRARQEDVAICFITTSNDFYREAYNLYVLQYLIKPVRDEELQRLLDRVMDTVLRKDRSLTVRSRKQTICIPYNTILYMSSREHTVSICCEDGAVHECSGRLTEMEQELQGGVFLRCHQSFLVNMYHVDSMSGTQLMIAGHQIPVSRRYYADVRARYHEIMFEEVG